MLSVQPLKSAQGAADYYAAAFNYYAGDAQALRWLGEGCAHLRLAGIVQKEQMLALLEGQLPNGQVLKNKTGEHRPGFDMTFSAPKSVSILIGLQADPNLEKLHDIAVERAIGHIEKEFAQARVVIDGKVYFVNTGNFVIAAFRQPSSRANDPATHTHAVTMNITFTDEDGKARSLASDIHGHQGVVEQLQQHVTYAGLIYRTEYANLLKPHSYRLEDVGKGMFEIEGFPKEILREFSTRRVEIEEKMEKEGWEGARLASKATLLTRNAKEEHDIHVLRADWQKRADDLGFDAKGFVQSHKDVETSKNLGFFSTLKEKLFERFYGKEDLAALKAKEAVFVAIETISQQTSVFEIRQLKEAALKHSLAGRAIVSIEAIDKEIQQNVKKQTLYQATDPITNQPMLTTPWALTLETETLSRIAINQGILKPIANTHTVLQAQKSYEASASFPLTASQKNALMHVFTSEDRFNAIQGYAGTGKTTMLQLTSQIAEKRGFTLRGTAVTSSAVNELRQKAGIHSDVFPIIHQELLKAPNQSLQKTLYILDEASMLSTIQGHELIKLIEKKGARLLLTGDNDQLSSVKCGRIFGQSQEYGIATCKMTDIIRQTNTKAMGAVRDAINRELYDSLQKLDEVREVKTHDERIETIAKHWLALSHAVRERTLLFAPTHANRHDITTIIRDGLKKEGTLNGEEHLINTLKPKATEEIQYHHMQYYQKGDILRFNLQLSKCRIQSGDYLTVETITEKHRANKTIPLINSEGKPVLFRLKDLPEYKATRAGLNRLIEFYEPKELRLCKNDQVLITRNNNKAGLVNSALGQVKSISGHEITLLFEKDNEEKTFPLGSPELKHLDYGYVLTNMKVQGKDKVYALGLIESYNKFSATLRNYYVQVSRAISRITLITDDKGRLCKALELNDDTKKSALDYVDGDTVKNHAYQFANHPKAIDISPILNKKVENDVRMEQNRSLIGQYVDAKENQKTAIASMAAWKIMNDVTLKRMARHQQGFSESTLRQDGLRLATCKLLKGLSFEEREKALTVKSYLEACHETQAAWKSIHQGNKSSLQKTIAFDKSETRNALAAQIAERIEAYKPYLQHFSIGKLNRFGVPQYHIEKGEERAVVRLKSLSLHADKHQVSTNVARFFKEENLLEKGVLAIALKSQAKAIHPHLVRLSEKSHLPLDGLWREINQHAKRAEENIFREGLPPQERPLFDMIKNYKSLNQELATQFTSSLYALNKGKELPGAFLETQRETAHLRNKIAASVSANPSFDSILDFFKIKKEKIIEQKATHNKRETVLIFKESTSNFEQRRDAALAIAADIKMHYPFIKEFGLDTKMLNTLVRIEERRIFMSELNKAQKQDFQQVMAYKITSRKAASTWKAVFSAKEQGKSLNAKQVTRAQEFTANRDNLGALLHEKKGIDALLLRERLDPTKIELHARQHTARLNTVAQLIQTKDALFHQLDSRLTKMNKQESYAWHRAWGEWSHGLKQVYKNSALYQRAIECKDKSSLALNGVQKKLLSRYELDRASNQVVKLERASHSTQISLQKEFLDAATITSCLTAKSEETYRAIFGEPKTVNSKEMRYSGGLIVSLKGNKAGSWYDFAAGVGGNPISAIMRERGLTFEEALKEGAAIAGISGSTASTPRMKPKNIIDTRALEEEKNKIISAKSILKGGVSIKGTLAEKYLKEHRGIEEPERLNTLFWPQGAVWKATNEEGSLYEKNNKIPALLIAARNEKGEITGVQRIYLDAKTAQKNNFMEHAKLSKGKIEGSAGILQKGERGGTLYLVEGPETGASIAMANPTSTVLVSFGLSNLKNLNSLIKNFFHTSVVIAGDNDSQAKNNTTKMTLEAQETLKNLGINAEIITPRNIDGRAKTDWNDVHKSQGLQEVKSQLGLIENNPDIHNIARQLNQEKSNNLDKYITEFSQGKNQVSKAVLLTYNSDQSKFDNLTVVNNSQSTQNLSEIKQVKQLLRNQITLDMDI